MDFHQVAVPHRDILSGSYSGEVYAAKLWEVYNRRGSDEYADADTFFKKTYMTDHLKAILDSIKDRLDGKGGGHFLSIATPFGGGKTHTLIALYHKCVQWGARPVVLVGNEMDPKTQTPWGMIEEQLTGRVDKLEGLVPRGGEALRGVLKGQDAPVLILIDELLQYVTRADGVRINDTTLATQTIAFMQELSETAGSLPNVCVVVTLPSSANEQLDDEQYAKLYGKLKKVAGRVQDTITPVSDSDIPRIIRRRLFSSTDDEIRDRAEGIVGDFVDYCEDEGLIPDGKQPSEYREDFMNSYPFLPQVIDVLYHRWGTITQFQRTRGVLRLLSLVVGSLAKSKRQFISLGDFDLSNDAIRQELMDYLEPPFNGVVAKDIVGDGSGAAKVDAMVPNQYKGKQLGMRAAAAIFMYSHSGGAEINGATEPEIKRATCERGIPAAQISGVLNLFRNHLFYLSTANDRYAFTKEANVLKIKMDMMENLKQRDVDDAEKDTVRHNVGGARELRTILWPSDPRDVDDSAHLKLAIMRTEDRNLMDLIHDMAGESNRTHRNNLFFLAPSDGERGRFMASLKSKVAWERIRDDPLVKLKDDQRATLTAELKKEEERLAGLVKDYYSVLYVPEKNHLNPSRVRAPPMTDSGIGRIVYDHLVENEEVNQSIGPVTLKTRYLEGREHVETPHLLKTMLSVPGELRPASRDVLQDAIVKGVSEGEFGLGEVRGDGYAVRFFRESPMVSFEQGEVLIQASLCKGVQKKEGGGDHPGGVYEEGQKKDNKKRDQGRGAAGAPDTRPRLDFAFDVPEGQVNNISQMLLNITRHYRQMRLRVTAADGGMSQHDIDMIKEALRQIGAESDLE